MCFFICNDRSVNDEKDVFWKEFRRVIDAIGNGYHVMVIANFNGWIGKRVRGRLTRVFGVDGENENG